MFFKTPASINSLDMQMPILLTYTLQISNTKNMLGNLQGALEKMLHWFPTNNLVANAEKCYCFTSSKTPVDIHISSTEILNE